MKAPPPGLSRGGEKAKAPDMSEEEFETLFRSLLELCYQVPREKSGELLERVLALLGSE